MKLSKCSKHGKVAHIERSDGLLRCGKCASSWVVKNRRKKKERLVRIFGGKCERCGYNKYIGALDFHHKDPRKKLFSLSVKGLCYSWSVLLREASKCMLLCKNCHAEIQAVLSGWLPRIPRQYDIQSVRGICGDGEEDV